MKRLMAAIGVAGVLGSVACTGEKVEDGELPDVDVSADPGKLPEYDVDPARVNVGRDTQTVVTPDVQLKPAPAEESTGSGQK